MADTWYKIYCSVCKAVNWWSNGDESDLSLMDVEVIRCHNCKTYLDTDGEEIDCVPESSYMNDVEGLEKPE